MKNEVNSLKDLRSGYVVKLRNGRRYQVIRVGRFTRALVCPHTRTWHYLESTYNEDLTCKKNCPVYPYNTDNSLDIMEVYGLVTSTDCYPQALNCETLGRDLLWKRNEAKKMTVNEISKLLGYEVEIVGER